MLDAEELARATSAVRSELVAVLGGEGPGLDALAEKLARVALHAARWGRTTSW